MNHLMCPSTATTVELTALLILWLLQVSAEGQLVLRPVITVIAQKAKIIHFFCEGKEGGVVLKGTLHLAL